jgi:nitric oxide reductase subunit C
MDPNGAPQGSEPRPHEAGFSNGQKAAMIGAAVALFAVYTVFVDAGPIALRKPHPAGAPAAAGKLLYQKYNCQACHQVYGLGGYMGPDLTNVYSASGKGPAYIAAFLRNGTSRMPNFHLSERDVSALVAYLALVDATGTSPIRDYRTTWYGSIEFTGRPQ